MSGGKRPRELSGWEVARLGLVGLVVGALVLVGLLLLVGYVLMALVGYA
jgi:hypothetical protein